jgi:hypothetical protein
VSPFDKEDPDIQRILALDWKHADFQKLDQRSRTMAYFALNRGLTAIGAKADARLDLLMDYVADNDLEAKFLADKQTAAEPPVATYETMLKVAAAFIAVEPGKSKLEKEFGNTPQELLPRYQTMYEKSSRRAYDDAAVSRFQVRLLANFLVREGKFEEFKKWSEEEKKRRQAEYQAELAAKRAAAAEAEQDRRQQALMALEQKRQQEAELAARQAEYAVENQSNAAVDGGGDYWGGEAWYGYGVGYYDNLAYRAQVREKAQNAWQNWQAGRPANLPARAAGRRGGRR